MIKASVSIATLLLLVACNQDKKETIVIQGSDGTKATIEMPAVDPEQVKAFKADFPSLKSALDRCYETKEASTKCRSAHIAIKELNWEATRKSIEQPKEFERFKGGSYDHKKP